MIINQLSNKLSIVHDSDLLTKFESYIDPKEEHKNASVHEKHGHIPDHLICRISDDLMEEPVILESGFTYEKA